MKTQNAPFDGNSLWHLLCGCSGALYFSEIANGMGFINVDKYVKEKYKGIEGHLCIKVPWVFVGIPNIVKAKNTQKSIHLSLSGLIGQVYVMVVRIFIMFLPLHSFSFWVLFDSILHKEEPTIIFDQYCVSELMEEVDGLNGAHGFITQHP